MRRPFFPLVLALLLFFGGCTSIRHGNVGGGTPAVHFELPDLSGTPRSLSEFSGKPVLIHFWSPKCAPCRPEMIALNELQKYFDGRVVVLAIASYSNDDELKDFSREIGADVPILNDEDNKVSRLYGVNIIPATFIVNAEGNFSAIPDPDGGASGSRFDGPRGWNSLRAVDALKRLLTDR